jgi:hypothetical protein
MSGYREAYHERCGCVLITDNQQRLRDALYCDYHYEVRLICAALERDKTGGRISEDWLDIMVRNWR